MTDPAPVTDVVSQLGEGPCWLADTQELAWVDIAERRVHFLEPKSGEVETVGLDAPASVVLPADDGRLVVAQPGRLAWLDRRQGRTTTCGELAAEHPPNDGKVDPRGRLWIGTGSGLDRPGQASLYRVDGRATEMLTGVTISNGLDWSPDEWSMYYVDSACRRLDVFDFAAESGDLGERRTLVAFDESQGLPDGLTVDEEGNIWLAFWDGWGVHCYRPDGTLRGYLRLPVAQVTSCAFGGDDLGTLFVTTGAAGLSPADLVSQPLAGRLFTCRPGVRGREPFRFAGGTR